MRAVAGVASPTASPTASPPPAHLLCPAQGALRNHASVRAETDVTMVVVPRADFGAHLLSDEALRCVAAAATATCPPLRPPRDRRVRPLRDRLLTAF